MTAYRTDHNEDIESRASKVTASIKRVQGMTWCVRYRIGGLQHTTETTDNDLWRLCTWLADRADNSVLIVTPLP